MSEQYTYAVARIRALEVSLFSDSTIDQLIACQSYEQALQFLEEKGWGDTESSGNAEEILTREEEKTWEVFHLLAFRKVREDVGTIAGGYICPDAQLRERLLRIMPDGFIHPRHRYLPEYTILRDILA